MIDNNDNDNDNDDFLINLKKNEIEMKNLFILI